MQIPKLNTLQLENKIPFKVEAPFEPTGDQPQAINELAQGIENGQTAQVLLGATGTGKTFTIAKLIEKVQKPTLVIAHNKTLAAQLASEFKEFFPKNAVEYFVSYYDYYQPEAYIAQTDTYIEKDASINDEIDKLRHSATCSLFERRDVIIVASVSCIYGLGSPEDYYDLVLSVREGQEYPRDDILRKLVSIQYERNDINFDRGKFRVRGDVIEIFPAGYTDRAIRIELFGDEIKLVSIQYERNDINFDRGKFRVRGDVIEIFPAGYTDRAIRIELFGDEIDRILEIDTITGEIFGERKHVLIYPASHYVTSKEHLKQAVDSIQKELQEQLKILRNDNKLLESQRLKQRTNYDLETMEEMGYCSGIENYSRHLTGRKPGEAPYTLLDYFPDDFLIVIDESHVTMPQIKAMYAGDRSRKESLVNNGFRLPSAFDNRPLRFEEFVKHINQIIYVSATPAPYELSQANQIVEQIIRPTGLLDPEIEIRPLEGQMDDLLGEIKIRMHKQERVLITTLTKKMAENLTDYLKEMGIKVRYLHSDIATIERAEIIRDLRLGKFDVLIGINLLREGLDMPEVSLVAILDADKEGFLRSETSLIQTIGRAARNAHGKVIMYADRITDSMQKAIDETMRRREIQAKYNQEHHITPKTIQKKIKNLIETTMVSENKAEYNVETTKKKTKLTAKEKKKLILSLTKEMQEASRNLEFEKAAQLRDIIFELNGNQ